ncbi:MAG: GNAT family N-acetyltransferase [bacterium]
MEKAELVINRENADRFLDSIVELDAACFPQHPWDAAIWKGLFDHHRLLVYLVLLQKQPVGLLAASLLPPEAELLRFGVRQNFRRQSVGSGLLDGLVRELTRLSITTLFLEVREDNRPACLFYRAKGFITVGKRKDYYCRPRSSALILSYQVAQDNVPPRC